MHTNPFKVGIMAVEHVTPCNTEQQGYHSIITLACILDLI